MSDTKVAETQLDNQTYVVPLVQGAPLARCVCVCDKHACVYVYF